MTRNRRLYDFLSIPVVLFTVFMIIAITAKFKLQTLKGQNRENRVVLMI